ncbi:hypothetical protein OS493_019939 [Desmophyllum pertusum]|uniref:Helitron helicase-like domain-containing protein n=1 Tax=Desmophyllum pertusum TaxID=174260 RepID=A0A9W9YN99_9CNID|nr:hypothetical protein OS493_019939 [Desmophyllum pertusum]
MKGGMFRLTWSKKSVLEKIAQLDVDSRRRCEAAYQFLIASDDSAYLRLLQREISQSVVMTSSPVRSWCETGLDGSASRLSSKAPTRKHGAATSSITTEVPGYRNINTAFYRFEFQQRGTVHLHMLVFLKEMRHIRLNTIRADVPWSEPELAHLVHKLQPSDKGALPQNDGPSELLDFDGQPCLRLHHPADAFAANLRAYISTLVPALKCRMDVQTSDGNLMLLKYVTSYVAKCHDNQMTEALYSNQVNPFQAAYRHLRVLTPLEPEMLMALTSKRVAYTPSRTKKITCPLPSNIQDMSSHVKYKARKPQDENLSFLEWLRLHDESKPNAPAYTANEDTRGHQDEKCHN